LELSLNKSVEEAFRRTGVRITPQRFSVLEHLMLHPDHATVDDLAAALNRRYAKASRATVYNTLHALVEAGLVREFTLDGKAARYDANVDPHHHFVCDVCGAVEDLEWFEVPALHKQPEPKMPRTQKGERSVSAYNVSAHNVRSYEVIVRGECRRCR
jgi:Fe2+ or Zn2+ uptake regulation protein